MGLYKLVSDNFHAGAIGSQFHADTAVNGTAFRLSEGSVSDDGDGCSSGEDVVDTPAGPEVIEFIIIFFISVPIGELFFLFLFRFPSFIVV